MSGRFRRLKVAVAGIVLFAALVWLNNTSHLADPLADRPYLIAHRALGQGFHREGLNRDTCTASRMLPSEHPYLENTIPAMRAAFELGADAVEIDVHSTVDDRFAVFHDWTVDCRTEASGVTHEHTLAELQRLDVGCGYTADGGRTWPFRGKGVGMMPSLEQVLTAFSDRDFFIDVKSNEPDDGVLLAERLTTLTGNHDGEIVVFGGPRSVGVVRERVPGVRTTTRPRIKRCLKSYLAVGWTGYVPSACRNTSIFVPANVAPWLWGWSDRLLRRMNRVGTDVVLIGDYDGGPTRGIGDPNRLAELPRDYSGAIWTDRIDLIGPAARED